ncbi:hypothetical protein PGT21_022017 [Puccinia graminis f. sp. tritici]|uniref:Uncharacterized protein n=1 Tax=Puccinia graminis f. sp. tritici TaxID=56615 RepID=A0A5B0MCD5_PUCGR|nr:hypothetical protein PGT21_022017 [Puccinia graminis f. sp. tritici]
MSPGGCPQQAANSNHHQSETNLTAAPSNSPSLFRSLQNSTVDSSLILIPHSIIEFNLTHPLHILKTHPSLKNSCQLCQAVPQIINLYSHRLC